MSSPFLGEIRIFGLNFAPRGWLQCNGQLLPISQYTAVFSLLGTYYGGNGTSNFQLPNFQGTFPLGQGQGPGLTDRNIGETGGEANVTLLSTEIPSHYHTVACTATDGTESPSGAVFGGGGRGKQPAYAAGPGVTAMANLAVGVAGGSQPHNNLPPYLTLNFCIAIQGVFPSRS
jgi:microcystin-dependent protein